MPVPDDFRHASTCARHRSYIGNARKRECYIDPLCARGLPTSTLTSYRVHWTTTRPMCPLAATPLFSPFRLWIFENADRSLIPGIVHHIRCLAITWSSCFGHGKFLSRINDLWESLVFIYFILFSRIYLFFRRSNKFG